MARHWWPQHPPYPFPWKDLAVWSVLCTDKHPHRHMSQINIKVFLHCWINQVLYKWSWTGFARCSDGFSPTASTFHKRHFNSMVSFCCMVDKSQSESSGIFWKCLSLSLYMTYFSNLVMKLNHYTFQPPPWSVLALIQMKAFFFSLYRLLSFKNACIQKNIFLLMSMYWLESSVVM